MESVRSWALAVCSMCVMGAMLSMIFPKNNSGKLLQMILSVMILCVVFQPIRSLGKLMLKLDNLSFDETVFTNQALEDEIQDSAKSVYAGYLEENLKRVLDGSGISYERIAVMMDNSDDGCISIGQVEVIVKNEEKANEEAIKKILRNYIGFEPVVRAE